MTVWEMEEHDGNLGMFASCDGDIYYGFAY